MRKSFFAICSILLLLVVSIAVLGQGCEPTGRGYIVVAATLCDEPWQGALNYTLTGANSTITYSAVAYSFNVDPGTWTCEYVSGGPPGAHLESITPDPTQEVAADGLITFTLNFELDQDAGIEFAGWTIDGTPIEESGAEYEEGVGWHVDLELWSSPIHTIDVHFKQWVDGCPERVVAVNETSWLQITQTEGPSAIEVRVANNLCAVDKEPPPGGRLAVKNSQVTSFNGDPVEPPEWFYLPDEPAVLDVETAWELEKCNNYTKSINWFSMSDIMGFEPPPCVLFHLVGPETSYPWYEFTLIASAEVALVDDEDVNPGNNYAEGAPLTILLATPW
jgi:hypothetical protein